MHDTRPAFRISFLLLALLSLAGCGGGGLSLSGSGPAPEVAAPAAPPVSLAGTWLLSSPGRGQCRMTFGAATPGAAEGTIAPEGGCPGKFFTSRKWTFDQAGLTMRDHKNQPLAQLSGNGGAFEGKATAGEQVTLTR